MANDRQIFGFFRSRFDSLIAAVKDDPRRLQGVQATDKNLKQLASDLMHAADNVERLQSEKKVVQNVDPHVLARWKQYREKWKMSVWYAGGRRRSQQQGQFSLIIGEMPSFENYRNEYREYIQEDPDPNWYPFDFDPQIHEGGRAVERLFETMREYRERAAEQVPDLAEDDPGDDSDYEALSAEANILTVGLQAVDYFQENIGISISGSFKRWNKLKPTMIPIRVSDVWDSSGKNPLFELLNDAIRAYVAGAPAAAVAMCRAALETVLKDYYLSEVKLEKRDLEGRIKSMQHDEVINLAVERYNFLDKTKLHDARKFCNRILHNYSRHRTELDEHDAELVSLFGDLRHWIEMAPDAN